MKPRASRVSKNTQNKSHGMVKRRRVNTCNSRKFETKQEQEGKEEVETFPSSQRGGILSTDECLQKNPMAEVGELRLEGSIRIWLMQSIGWDSAVSQEYSPPITQGTPHTTSSGLGAWGILSSGSLPSVLGKSLLSRERSDRIGGITSYLQFFSCF